MTHSVEYILTHAEEISRRLQIQEMELAEAWDRIADMERALSVAQSVAASWHNHRWWHHLTGGSLG